jgi:hypothetical protein
MDKNEFLTFAGRPLRDWDVGTLNYLIAIYCGPRNVLRYDREVRCTSKLTQQEFKRIISDLIFEKELESVL